MKYVLIRYQDGAPAESPGAVGLLDVAKTSYLQELAQAGAVGVLSPHDAATMGKRRRRQVGLGNELQAHLAWLGYARPRHAAESTATGDEALGEADCYAAGLGVEPQGREVGWCCELVTQHDGRVIDPTAGGITTKETAPLIALLNARLGGPTRRWVTGEQAHHLVMLQASPEVAALATTAIDPPEHLIGRMWRRHLPRHAAGIWLRALLDEAAGLLERHEINKVRVDLGENPANMVWLWGPGTGRRVKSFKARYGCSGAVISTAFPLRGIAQRLGLTHLEGPTRLEERDVRRLSQKLLDMLDVDDVIYLPVRIEQVDPVDRQCAMERLDHHFLKPVVEQLMQRGAFRCLVAVDDRTTSTMPFVAFGAHLPSHPAVRLTPEAAAHTPLAFQDGTALLRWFLDSSGLCDEPSREVVTAS